MREDQSGPRTILHLISRLSVGGVENQLRLVCSHYDRNQFAPLVCSIRDKGTIGREIEQEGTEVIALGRKRVHQFDPTLVLELYRVLRNRNVYILRTHQYEAGFYGRLAAFWARSPLVVSSFHNLYRRRKWHRERINRGLSMFTDRIVAVSECVRADIIRFDRVPAQKVRVVRNGIDLSHFQREVKSEEVKIALGLTPEARILGTVGRMTPQKDQATLLEAFARLPRGRDLKLLFIGDGPLRMRLQKKAEDLKISGHVCFAGPRRDIYPLLCAMEVFVLPSLWEGMPTAIIEAMAAGKAVVASDIPPVKEIVSSPELGVLVPPGDAEALAEVLQQVLEDPGRSRRMGRLAQEYAWARFPIQKAVSQYQDLFGEIDRETQGRRSIS